MLELAEALEKYTVIQLLAATPLMFVVWLIIREINGVVRGGKSSEDQQSAAQDTAKIIAETLGGIIANELKDVKEDMSTDQKQNAEEHQKITAAMNQFGSIMERIVTLITTHNDKAEAYRNSVGQIVGELTTNLDNTNQVVEVMKTDIDAIKTDLASVKTTVNNLETRGLPLDQESLALLKQFIKCAKDLETQLSKVSQEIPAIIPDSDKPKTEAKAERPKTRSEEEV
jgi:exonuclease VII small subunit